MPTHDVKKDEEEPPTNEISQQTNTNTNDKEDVSALPLSEQQKQQDDDTNHKINEIETAHNRSMLLRYISTVYSTLILQSQLVPSIALELQLLLRLLSLSDDGDDYNDDEYTSWITENDATTLIAK